MSDATNFPYTPESFAEAIGPTLKAFEEKAEPHIRRIVDEVYDRLLGSVQDYLRENAEWNLGAEIRRFDLIQRESIRLHDVNRTLLNALVGLHNILATAESNASGNPEWESVSFRVRMAREAIELATPKASGARHD